MREQLPPFTFSLSNWHHTKDFGYLASNAKPEQVFEYIQKLVSDLLDISCVGVEIRQGNNLIDFWEQIHDLLTWISCNPHVVVMVIDLPAAHSGYHQVKLASGGLLLESRSKNHRQLLKVV